jgi:phospholipid/cholesterol/gamma-HCH transport system ATP-binding protein
VNSTPEAPCHAVEFRHVTFSYDERPVLVDVSFTVACGEIKIILSGSGGGKSTILRLILGLEKPDQGQILVNGIDITGLDENGLQPVRDCIGMVFQENALFDSLSVYDNVAFRLHERGVPEEEIEREVRALLKFVGLESEIDRLPAELSGGMQKRVGIARALVGDPKLVLFDEPTVGLDPPTSHTISDLVIALRDLERVASVLVTHEMDVVKYLATNYMVLGERGEIGIKPADQPLSNTTILMLRKGREIFSGTEEELVQSTDPYIQEFLAGTELSVGQPASHSLLDPIVVPEPPVR